MIIQYAQTGRGACGNWGLIIWTVSTIHGFKTSEIFIASSQKSHKTIEHRSAEHE
jgi:hypothetical protein